VQKPIRFVILTLLLTLGLAGVGLAGGFKCNIWQQTAGFPASCIATGFFKTYAEAKAWGDNYTKNLPAFTNTTYAAQIEQLP
jgi:hypothetical protein